MEDNDSKPSKEVDSTSSKSKTLKAERGEWVNLLTSDNLIALKRWLIYDGVVVEDKETGFFFVNKTRDKGATKTLKNKEKYYQFDPNTKKLQDWLIKNKHSPLPSSAGKQLIHLVWWRATQENHPSVDPSLHISHTDSRKKALALVQESPDLNESRKYCHKFGWYLPLKGEDRPRCPHWEYPCSGPLREDVHVVLSNKN